MELLENMMTSLKMEYPYHDVIPCGDINSRTGTENDCIENDSIEYLPLDDIGYEVSTTNLLKRNIKN